MARYLTGGWGLGPEYPAHRLLPPRPRTDGDSTQHRLDGRWSRKHERCVHCERTDRPHAGFGYCRICYQSVYRRSDQHAAALQSRNE